MPIIAVADIYGIAGRRQELISTLAGAERDATARDGCLRYSVAATLDDHDHFVTFSAWRDQAAVDAHYGSREFAEFQMALDGLLARPSEMTMYEVSGEVRPVPSGPMDPRDAD